MVLRMSFSGIRLGQSGNFFSGEEGRGFGKSIEAYNLLFASGDICTILGGFIMGESVNI